MTEALMIAPPDTETEIPILKTRPRRHIPAPDMDSSRIVWIATEKIRPNRAQPRINFESNASLRLADSVRRYGILHRKEEDMQSTSPTNPCLKAQKPLITQFITSEAVVLESFVQSALRAVPVTKGFSSPV